MDDPFVDCDLVNSAGNDSVNSKGTFSFFFIGMCSRQVNHNVKPSAPRMSAFLPFPHDGWLADSLSSSRFIGPNVFAIVNDSDFWVFCL